MVFCVWVAGFLKMIKTTFDRYNTLKTMKKVWYASFNIPIIPIQTYFKTLENNIFINNFALFKKRII